jgi:hypothetical protein
MAKFLSNTQKNLTVGVKNYTDLETVLTVIGNTNITGNLFVSGGQFLIDSETFTLKDPLIELGLVKDPQTGDLVPPSQDLGNDVGMVLHYFDNATNSPEKAAMYYDNNDDRMKFVRRASVFGNSVIASAYAALEVSTIWINDCVGQSQIIRCDETKNERLLENISLDCGQYT